MTDQPPALRDRIAEALMAWTERNANPQYATLRRSETVRQNAYSRADAVLAVLADHDRDAARQTTGQDDTGQCVCDTEPEACAAVGEDPTIAEDPTPLRWGLGDVLHGDDDTVTVYLSGPDREPYWLELDPERAAAFRQDLTPPAAEDTIGLCGHCGVPRENHHHGYTSTADVIAASPYSRTDDEPAPAVGQPAEAHDTDEAEILARAASDLCAFGHGEAAAFLRDRVKALMGPGAWVPQYGRPLTPEEQDAETLAAADTVEGER